MLIIPFTGVIVGPSFAIGLEFDRKYRDAIEDNAHIYQAFYILQGR